MAKTEDIKFQELGVIKELIKLLNIEIGNEAKNKEEFDGDVGFIAIYQIKNNGNKAGKQTNK